MSGAAPAAAPAAADAWRVRRTLDDAPLAGRTGRGVTVAVVDSGIHAAHPHVGGVRAGVHLLADGAVDDDAVDRLGHGTAVAAAIREKAPDAGLLAVRVFDDALATSAARLARGIRWAADHGARLVNLSLGTRNPAREPVLRAAVDHAAAAGALVVSARALDGVPWLPGCLPGVAGVCVDWAAPRDALELRADAAGAVALHASAYPRPIPGVPPERNLAGVSFAVANATGFLARLLEAAPDARTVDDVVRLLSADPRPP